MIGVTKWNFQWSVYPEMQADGCVGAGLIIVFEYINVSFLFGDFPRRLTYSSALAEPFNKADEFNLPLDGSAGYLLFRSQR